MLFNMTIDDLERGSPHVDGTEEEHLLSDGEEGPGDVRSPVFPSGSSTPEGEPPPEGLDLSPVEPRWGPHAEGVTCEFLPNARNVRRARVPFVGEEVPGEPSPRTSAVWKAAPIGVFKYVDDGLQIQKVNMETAVAFERGGNKFRTKHAIPSQNLYQYIVGRAKSIGMKVNHEKTKLMCLSDAFSFRPEATIEDCDGTL